MKNIDLTEVLAAARGEVPADIVLKGGCIFNSFTGEFFSAYHQRVIV